MAGNNFLIEKRLYQLSPDLQQSDGGGDHQSDE